MKLKGADIILECLHEQGVDTIFGYPGGTILNVYDALYKFGKINHILTAHEQGAAHAADGYARATGKVGVCMATSGPGATNLVTGIATAYMDSIPLVAITCNVAESILGKDSFQEVDIMGITMPITKHNYIVSKVGELADTIREAFYIANSGRKGPVLIDILKNVTVEEAEYTRTELKKYIPTLAVSEKEFDEVADIISSAKRPFIIAGGGIISSNSSTELYDFVKRVDAPISLTLMGISAFPSDEKEYVGLIGMHGTKASNLGIYESDVIIAIGTRFSDRVVSNSKGFVKTSRIIHIDIDPAEISKNVPAFRGLVGDAKLILKELLKRIPQKTHTEWMEKIRSIKGKKDDFDECGVLNPKFMLREINAQTKGDAVIVTEVGQHQVWTAQYYKFNKPRTLLTSGGLGTMGFGTGASMGACIGQDKRVISIAGDGCFRMNCNELSTIRYYNLPVIIIVFNNGVLGMVRQWQTLLYGKRYSQTNLDRGPDFVALAKAYGIDGYSATTEEEFKNALSTALSKNEPAVIDAKIFKDSFVLPMVSPSKSLKEMIEEVKK